MLISEFRTSWDSPPPNIRSCFYLLSLIYVHQTPKGDSKKEIIIKIAKLFCPVKRTRHVICPKLGQITCLVTNRKYDWLWRRSRRPAQLPWAYCLGGCSARRPDILPGGFSCGHCGRLGRGRAAAHYPLYTVS